MCELSYLFFLGNYDIMQQSEKISTFSKDIVCFMFLDEETEAAIKKISTVDNTKRIGLWRVVVVHNLPYPDPTAFVKISLKSLCSSL